MGRAKDFFEPKYRPEWLWDGLVEFGDTECWTWKFKHSERGVPLLDGGDLQTKRIFHDVRRIVYREVVGKFPYGRAFASCGNLSCCNPTHLSFGGNNVTKN